MDKDTQIIAGLVTNGMGIESGEIADEAQLLSAIIDRVQWMLDYDTDLLMSYLYRLDILEHKIKAVLRPGQPYPAAEGLGMLILDRQKERMVTKKKYKQTPIEGWEF